MQVLAHELLQQRVRPEVPLEREVDLIVELADLEALLDVLGAEAARAGCLVEDEAEVAGLRALERAAHLVDRPLLAARVRVEELNRRAEGELVVVQLLGERLRRAAAPARDLP